MRYKTLIITLIALIILLKITSAAESLENDPIFEDVTGGANYVQNITENENPGQFLAKEWTNFLKNNAATNWIYKLDPLFKFLLGQPFTISWAFFTTLLLWIIILSIYYPPIKMSFKDNVTSIGISILLVSLTAQLTSPWIIGKISNLVKGAWYAAGMIVIEILVLILINRISNSIIRKIVKKTEEGKISSLENEAKKNKALREGAENTLKGAEEMERSRQKNI